MMEPDDIRNHRIQAEKDANFGEGQLPQGIIPEYTSARATLALWVIAEQLYEIRANFAILLERTENKGRL